MLHPAITKLMYLPQNGELIKYLLYSQCIYLDVLYKDDTLFVSETSLCLLLNVSKEKLESVILETCVPGKEFNPNLLDSSSNEFLFDLSYIANAGAKLNTSETDKFLSWANERMEKIRKQRNGDFQMIHSHRFDLDEFESIQPEIYYTIENDNGVSLELLTKHLIFARQTFDLFIDKMLEIINANRLTLSDIEFLDSIDLCYSPRRLHEEVRAMNDRDFEDNLFRANLYETIEKRRSFETDNFKQKPGEFITSLRIKILQWNVEPEHMLNLMNRYFYFSYMLMNYYLDVTFDIERDEKLFSRFSFESTQKKAREIDDLNDRKSYYTQTKINAMQKLIDMDEDDKRKEGCLQFIEKCTQSIELTDYAIAHMGSSRESVQEGWVTNKTPENSVKAYNGNIKPAIRRKTDIIKILSAMYDAKMFVDSDGNPLTNKQKMMEAFGEFLGEDFSSYSASLSQAKTRDERTFLKPFNEIEKEAVGYFNRVED